MINFIDFSIDYWWLLVWNFRLIIIFRTFLAVTFIVILFRNLSNNLRTYRVLSISIIIVNYLLHLFELIIIVECLRWYFWNIWVSCRVHSKSPISGSNINELLRLTHIELLSVELSIIIHSKSFIESLLSHFHLILHLLIFIKQALKLFTAIINLER